MPLSSELVAHAAFDRDDAAIASQSSTAFSRHLRSSAMGAMLSCAGAAVGTSELTNLGWAIALASMVFLVGNVSAARTTRNRVTKVFLFSVGMFAAGSYWTFNGIQGTGQSNLLLSCALWSAFICVFAALHGLTYYVADFFSVRILGSGAAPLIGWFILPTSWLAAETLRSHGMLAFPWILIGTTQIDNPVLKGWFSVAGVQGVTVLAWWIASSLYVLIRSAYYNKRFALQSAALLLGICGLSMTFSHIHWTHASTPVVRALLLHTHLVDFEKWDVVTRDKAWNQLVASFDVPNVDIVVTPETFLGDPAQLTQPQRWRDLISLARVHLRHLLIGVPYITVDTSGGPAAIHNVIMQLGPDRGDFYVKQRLVPFGEFLPLKKLLGDIYRNVFSYPLQDFSIGSEQNAQNLFGVGSEIVTTICYDIAFADDILRRAASAGWIVQISNDAWFNSRLFEAQSLNIARTRALETGRPVARANNVGVTGLIDHEGNTTERAARGLSSYLQVSVNPRTGLTPYMRIGYWNTLFVCFALLMLGASVNFLIFRRRICRSKDRQ